MKLAIPQTHFLEASAILRMGTPPVINLHEGLHRVFDGIGFAKWRSSEEGVIVVSRQERLLDAAISFWTKPHSTVRATEALAALALTSALLPSVIANIACHATAAERKADAHDRIIRMAGALSLHQKIIKLYMIAGGHKGSLAEAALGGALVRWLGLEANAWKQIRVSVDNLGLTPGMCVTVARHFFENAHYEEAAALLLSELENIAIADVADPVFVQAASAAGIGVVSPPEIFQAAGLISRMLPLISCDVQHRHIRIDALRGWLLVHHGDVIPTANIDGIVVDRMAAELCSQALNHPGKTGSRSSRIAMSCIRSLAA